ncbi:MAG: transposase, partial [Oscillospiraceae bacterium]|nr:transposase [Oscillospiraceae bacterium]
GEERVDMCEAIEGIRNDAKAEGVEEGFLKALIGLVKDGILTIADAAKRADMTVPEFEEKTGLKA